MIEQQARVFRSHGETASVRIGGQTGCAACDEGRGCGAGIFGKLLRRNPVEVEVANPIGAAEGQAVRLGISESLFLRLVMRLYGWPLLAALAGATLGQWIAFAAGAGPVAADLAALGGAVAAAGVVLKFRGRNTIPEIGGGDVLLLANGETESACGARRDRRASEEHFEV